MKGFLFILFSMISTYATAQKFSITGQLMDTLNNPLPSATVLLLNPADSSLVNFTVSDAHGNFELKNITKDEHLLKITFVGFRSFTQKIPVSGPSQAIALGKIVMEPVSNELEAVEIRAEKAPVTIKKDTIEFNAGSFKTKQNAVVEDLLRKLPGVEIDNEGNITAQGEQVSRVTVDGKNFFGTDPKLATKNLPADAIDKVQVFDKKSDQAIFSGIDDGQREKTINLELKEEKRNGAFGTLMAGGGTDNRYQSRANINRFSKSRQISFLGMANNVNEQGFSIGDYMNFTGGSQKMMGGGGGGVRISVNSENTNGIPLNLGNRANGILSNYAGGINMNNEFNRKTELNGSYFYNYLDHNKDQNTFRQNFLPPGSSANYTNFTFNQDNKQENTNTNHRLNLSLDHKVDSVNTLKSTTRVTYNETDSRVSSMSENLNGEVLRNKNQSLSLASGGQLNANETLLWRHKFSTKGRTLSTNVELGISQYDRNGYLDGIITHYDENGNTPIDSIFKQSNNQSTKSLSYGGTISYTEPLGGRKYLEANYSYRQNQNEVERTVYDVTDEVAEYDPSLSNHYTSRYQYHRAGLNFKMNKRAYNVLVGGSIQQTYLDGDLKLHDIEFDREYRNFLPAVRVNYDFSANNHLRFDYETSVQEPSIEQLQPVVDNSDPLNIYVGNPSLRPAYSQSWRVHFTTFNPMNFISFFAFADVDYITNAVTNARNTDEHFVSTTTPVNVDHNMRIAGNATVSFPIHKIGSRLSIGGTYRNERSVNLLNDVESTIDQQVTGGIFRYDYRYKEVFDLSLSARLQRQLTDYEFNGYDQVFLNNTYTADANISFLKNYQFSSTIDFLQYENKSNHFSQAIPLINLSISRYMLKNKAGELKFSVNNMLDKALGIYQTATLNYFERQTTNSLGRYFMLSFTYSLNKQLNPMGMGRKGMIRMMR